MANFSHRKICFYPTNTGKYAYKNANKRTKIGVGVGFFKLDKNWIKKGIKICKYKKNIFYLQSFKTKNGLKHEKSYPKYKKLLVALQQRKAIFFHARKYLLSQIIFFVYFYSIKRIYITKQKKSCNSFIAKNAPSLH